jgi:hypothetical protein
MNHVTGTAIATEIPGERRKAMRLFSGLSTIALAGALLATPAYAHDRVLSIQDAQNLAVLAEWLAMAQGSGVLSVEGQVAAVDHDSGRLVLDTDEGLVSVVTSPDELTNIEVGDVIRASFIEESTE